MTTDVMNIALPDAAIGRQEGWDYLPLFHWWPNPARANAELVGGWSGSGMHWETAGDLWVALLFAVACQTLRYVSKRFIFPPMARLAGVHPKKKGTIAKFSYNAWLALFYASSALFGYFFVLTDEKYFEFPLGLEKAHWLWNYHPQPVKPIIFWYYAYQLGFYFAELYAVVTEPKRSDFIEYVIHHLVTVTLIAVSYVAKEHRVGAIIIFLHDIPDIFLCVAKMAHYSGWENVSTCIFIPFVAIFSYLRLYCFPYISYSIFCLAPQFHPATTAFWFLAVLLGIVLQSLQFFWMAMIIKFLIGLALKGGKNEGDPRSDSEDESGVASADKIKRKLQKKTQ